MYNIYGGTKVEKVKLNKDMCIGCGACCSIASENFTFDGATAKVINEEVTDQAKEARVQLEQSQLKKKLKNKRYQL